MKDGSCQKVVGHPQNGATWKTKQRKQNYNKSLERRKTRLKEHRKIEEAGKETQRRPRMWYKDEVLGM